MKYPILCLFICVQFCFADSVTEVNTVRQNMLETLENRKVASAIALEWKAQKPAIEAQISATENSIARLSEKTDQSSRHLEQLKAKLVDLQLENSQQKLMSETYIGLIASIKNKVLELTQIFPDPLKSDLIKETALVRGTGDLKDYSTQKQILENSIGILNKANEFNRGISLTDQTRKRANEDIVQYKVLFIGLAAGYYFSEEQGESGTIEFTGTQWKWTEDNTLLPSLIHVESILANKAKATLIALPVTVK